jgi:hypothetical protein
MANIKPTHKEPISPQSKKFEKDFKKSMVTNNLNIRESQEKLNEIDEMLSEAEQSLKKKIFSLPKMEALVFSDPKLSAVYDKMAEDGEEKYGYHHNETIMNMIFNDYVLNSSQYLQKYKNAIPKEKKRRDKSGINQLKKAGKKKMDATGTKLDKSDVDETTSAGSAGGAAGYVGYAGPAAFSSKGDLMGDNKEKGQKIRKPIWKGGTIIQESNYLIDPSGFEKYVDMLNESSVSSSASAFVTKMGDKNNYQANQINTDKEWKELNNPKVSEIASEKKMKDKGKGNSSVIDDSNLVGGSNAKPTYKGGKIVKNPNNTIKENKEINKTNLNEGAYNDFEQAKNDAFNISKEEGVVQHVNQISDNTYEISDWYDADSTVASFENGKELNEMNLDEKSKSKAQQKFMGMVHAYQKGELSDSEVSDSVKKAAKSMTDKEAEDFASTKHKGLPEKVNEEIYDKIVDIQYFNKNNQLKHSVDNKINPNDLSNLLDKPIKIIFTDGSEERVNFDEFMQVYSHNDDSKLNINEYLSLHDIVEYLSDRQDEKPFMMGDTKWQFVNARYPDGKIDIGVYKFGDDLVYDYSRWMEEYNINENSEYLQKKDSLPQRNDKNIKEDTQTMIQNNGNSMSNKAQPTGDQGNGLPVGTQQTSGLNEAEKLLEEINKELEAFSIHHDKLKIMSEDRKSNSQILNARVGDENKKNFKKDFKNSDTKDVINVEKELQHKDQQTDVPKDPQKLGQDIEKQVIKNADMKSDESLKNVGNSTNNDGDEIPKRNLTTKEQEEVDLYRNGQHSLNYDNEPSERFVERMKADQGEFFEMGEKQKKFKGDAPMYGKDSQPVDDGIEKVQFDKNVKKKNDDVAWNERMGLNSNIKLSESMITGRYIDVLGKRRLMEFRLNEVKEIEKLDENILMELSFDGLGNIYLSKTIDKKVVVNEAVVNAMNTHKFYTDGKSVVAIKNPTQQLTEGSVKDDKLVVNEQIDKIKHLLGYKPDSFVNTRNVKKNRGF